MSKPAADLSSGKGSRDENFPVASRVLRPEHRGAVLAFYRFARKADDVADHPKASRALKLERLEAMRRTLSGEDDREAEALALRAAAAARGLGPRHGLDLLCAFRQDVDQRRYQTFEDLMDYCRVSAMPVGRFVLDVHHEDEGLWPASDALCAALQIINHLQDCAKDYRELGRVYLPLERLRREGVEVEALSQPTASEGLRQAVSGLAGDAQALLRTSEPFASGLTDARLAFEVAAIQRLAEDLARRLRRRDPLSERVHHRRSEALLILARAALDRIAGRGRRRAA